VPGAERTEAGIRTHKRKRRSWEWGLVFLVLLYAGVLILAPLLALIEGAFSEGIARLGEEVTRPDALNSLKLSLLLAAAATVVNTLFGTLIAWVLVRDRFRGKSLVNGLIDLPFAVSPVIAGLMLILLFGRNGWLEGLSNALGIKLVFAWPGMLLATVFVCLPFVIREIMPVLVQAGVQQEEAAFTMGASPWRTFWSVTFPAIRWGLFYGISLTFSRALGEFGAVLVVSGGVSGLTETVTLYIFRSLDDRNYVGAYSMALVLGGLAFLIMMCMELAKRGRARR